MSQLAKGARKPHAAEAQRRRWLLLPSALVLGLAGGWLHGRSVVAPRWAVGATFDTGVALVLILCATVAGSEIARAGGGNRLWLANVLLLAAAPIRRVLAHRAETPVLVSGIAFVVVWLALLLASKQRQRARALLCVWLCGGLATGALLLTTAR
jgi:hypothetical protein